MKKIFKTVLVVSIVVCIISLIGTFALKAEHSARIQEAKIGIGVGQYDGRLDLFGDTLRDLVALKNKIRIFYVFDGISGAAVLGSAIGLVVVTKKENKNIEQDENDTV